MMFVRMIGAVLLAAIVTPASAEVPNPGKMVCKSEKQAGTRVAKRTCMTAAEWDTLAESAKRSMMDTLRGGRPWQGDQDAVNPKLEGEGMKGPW